MEDQLNLSMFRAYDIRTPSAAHCPDLAAGWRGRRPATSARTWAHRASSWPTTRGGPGPQYLTIAVDAFRDAGLDVVYLPGACSTSYFYYAAMRHPRYAAVIVGASHNPAGDTGQKILGPGVSPIAQGIGPEGGLDRIKELYLAECARPRPGRGGAASGPRN